ncbi:MAG: DUF3450 family protein [Akkermansiaceae bacterium]
MKIICLIVSAVLIHSVSAQQGDPPKSEVDPVKHRELIRQWVQTERLIGEEKNAWQVEKQRLQTLLDLYQKELKLLDETITKAGSSAKKIDDRKQELEGKLSELRQARTLLRETLARLLPRLKSIIRRLPDPLKAELAADIDLLESADAIKQPREALKSTLSLLSSAARFNRSVTVAEEVREIDGKKMTVKVLYLGLARAYFAAQFGDVAGVGSPSEKSWSWDSRPEIADDVRKALAVYQKDQQPQLIKLPVSVSPSPNK